jgi:hypothetical protein
VLGDQLSLRFNNVFHFACHYGVRATGLYSVVGTYRGKRTETGFALNGNSPLSGFLLLYSNKVSLKMA